MKRQAWFEKPEVVEQISAVMRRSRTEGAQDLARYLLDDVVRCTCEQGYPSNGGHRWDCIGWNVSESIRAYFDTHNLPTSDLGLGATEGDNG